MNLPYNPSNLDSIIEYAKKLTDRTLRAVCDENIINHNYSGKGNFGQILEKYYFLYQPNSESEPDFSQVGLELKSSPLKQLRNNDYRSKERLVLNIINYMEVINQEFETSSFWKKNANLLLVFYLHQSDTNILDYLIKLVDTWSFPKTDLEIIKKDWLIIKQKILDGKAHEISEGDTYYLAACTKGANANSTRKQPNNDTPAKQRAYSLKQGYVNHIIASIANDTSNTYGKLIPTSEIAKLETIESIVLAKFEPLIGKTDKELIKQFDLEAINPNIKNYHARISKEIVKSVFNVPSNMTIENYIEEFNKAEIIVKTIRLKENGLPKEDISFPNFKFEEIVNEEWDDSSIKATLTQKFLFVFFQYEGDKLVLRKVKFWNMPFADIQEVEKVWAQTKSIIANGDIVKKVINGVRYTNFPNKKINHVSHVRPHATKASDTYPLPIQDRITNLNEYTKHCFWLNNSYVRDNIFNTI